MVRVHHVAKRMKIDHNFGVEVGSTEPVLNMLELRNERQKQIYLFNLFTDDQVGVPLGQMMENNLIESVS